MRIPLKYHKIKLKGIIPVVLSLLFLVLPLIISAQDIPDPDDTPIDGGLSLLLAAGLVYGFKKYRDVKSDPIVKEKI